MLRETISQLQRELRHIITIIIISGKRDIETEREKERKKVGMYVIGL